MTHPRLIIAGTSSGVGKTTVTLALLAALQARGRRVQPFKVGPDFIDPGHHTAVTGRVSRNLDGWMLGERLNREIFIHAATGADLSVIEGMMGLFDGSSPVNEIGSTAELAKQLAAPVLLVIDGSAMARSAAAMVAGYADFDGELCVAGVLFNRIGSEGHYRLLKEAVEAETDVAVVGYLKPDSAVTVEDRHLGLVTALERGSTDLYDRLAKAAIETVDLDLVERLAQLCGSVPIGPAFRSAASTRAMKPSVRIGVAYDPAFCFYYPENIELLEDEGAQVVRFSPMHDGALPPIDLLYLGGGYPELYGEQLANNTVMRRAIRSFAERGGTIYAECGGMMYLTRAIRGFDGTPHEMVGLFAAEAVMKKPGLTLGYRSVEVVQAGILGGPGVMARGHEFHYSTLVANEPLPYACALTDAQGRPAGLDGLVSGNVLALYTHLHFASRPEMAASLIDSARRTACS
ncbi:MAG: cobyrinate a,c-diamide synthase [Nitrospiraceae bacterium]|nr:cobyrinate a,c-diamide synthase [Nitrospiraceae bacterium]